MGGAHSGSKPARERWEGLAEKTSKQRSPVSAIIITERRESAMSLPSRVGLTIQCLRSDLLSKSKQGC